MEYNSQNIVVLVLSCDKYEDVWKPCAISLGRYWSDCPYRIYLLTETGSAPTDTIFSGTINVESSIWSRGLHQAMEQLEEEYVIMLMEDQWPTRRINQMVIDEAVRYISHNPGVAGVYFEPSPDNGVKTIRRIDDRYSEILFGSPYRLSCAPGVFRRDFVLRVTDNDESAWDFERYRALDPQTRDVQILEIKGVNWVRLYGYGAIVRGRWVRKMRRYAYQNGFSINEKQRKVMSPINSVIMSIKNLVFNISPKAIFRIQNTIRKPHEHNG